MPVLVTDADTPLGIRLVERLLALGGEVRAFCSATGDVGALRTLGAITASGDIDDVGRLEAACEQVHTVIHLGGGLLARRPEKLLMDMESVVEACANAGVRRLVFLSVVGADPLSPEPFRRVKGLAEQLAARGAVPSVAVRAALVDTPELRSLVAGTPLPADVLEHDVRAVRGEDLVDLLVALDDMRSRGEAGHAALIASGAPVSLAAWREHPGEVAPTYRQLDGLPLLVSGLGGPWVDTDPVPADAWTFAGIEPGIPSSP